MKIEMEKQLVPYELAKQLSEFGFKENCFAVYDNIIPHFCIFSEQAVKMSQVDERVILAPLWQQAFDWFREKYGLMGVPDYDETTKKYYYFINTMGSGEVNFSKDYPSYKEAQVACLEKLIEYSKFKEEEE